MKTETTQARRGGLIIGAGVAALAGGLLLMWPVGHLDNQYQRAWHGICVGSSTPAPRMSPAELPLALAATLLVLAATVLGVLSIKRLEGVGWRVVAALLFALGLLSTLIVGFYFVGEVVLQIGTGPAHCAG
ncbi:hypothetical protein [Actinoplanes regularis]|uniref:hypothetical protein n=1 Tax=Actinoplanes regularis TaxID=52697 RepID=UPI0024A5732A|nr:hypothetical protein [Actinoplanes regularis]GLW27489.1 hypothetical protein Areg01_04300 [Actinoplanes regularis]